MTEAIVVSSGHGADNSRVKKIAIGGLVLLLALYVLPKFVLGGGGGDTEDLGAPTDSSATPTAVAPGPAPAETTHAFSSKNPFAPLFDEAPAGESDVAASAPPPSPPVEPMPAPVEPVIVDTYTPPAAAPAPSSAPTAPVRFGLTQVGVDASGLPFASVRVDGGVFQAAEGQEFAGNYKVVSLDAASRCGVFLYGDQRFSLCEGEETTT